MDKKNKKDNGTAKKGFFSTLARWTKRMFFGASKELSEDDKFAVEKLESPSKLAVKAFFRRKLAVVALVILVAMFLFVFIGPYFLPVDLNYTDANMANIPPNYSMLRVPSDLKNNIRTISGFSNFTIGVSNDNQLYIWGCTENVISGTDFSEFPEELKVTKPATGDEATMDMTFTGISGNNVLTASAGLDHIVAITTEGRVVGWGKSNLGQFGYLENPKDDLVQMPEELILGTIDTSKVEQLICGYQATALVIDGKLHLWGNPRALLNMKDLNTIHEKTDLKVKKVALSNYYGVLLMEDGSITTNSNEYQFNFASAYSSKAEGNKVKRFGRYLEKKKVVDIAGTKNCFAFLCSDGELLITGSAQYDEDVPPVLADGEYFVSITGGTNHFAGITNTGKAYAWGHNDSKQADVNGIEAAAVYTGSKQTYVVGAEDELIKATGLKGYLMGTDNRGRDIFTRIVHGGKMTMTVGAVAVIVSTIIAIIIGCLSGYFGGWVDMLLMRITEIFSSIPFLPFAMMLSYVIQKNPIPETTRIIIIMVMLGLLSWTGLARMIRAQVLAEREKEFVTAAKSMGVKEKRIAFKHILPNVISVILVSVTLDFAGCMLTESSLSYLGFGVQQPRPTWGNMLDGANNSIVIQNYWWQWAFPALFLAIATISINIIGDTLRDVLDPKSSQEK